MSFMIVFYYLITQNIPPIRREQENSSSNVLNGVPEIPHTKLDGFWSHIENV